MSVQKKIEKVYEVFLFGAVLLVTGLIVYTNLFHYCYRMNADIASEEVLAQLIWEGGEAIPKSWIPSTEYRILSSANLGALFYGIFHNIEFAMGCASSILTFGILGSLYFFVSQFSFRREEKLLFLLLCLILPNHFMMLELFYLFCSYYAVHIILLFLTLGVYVRLLGNARVHGVWQVLLILFSFTIGMQGLRGILVLNAPMFATEIVRQIVLWYKKEWKKRDGYIAGWCTLLLLAGYAGTFAPFSVGQEISRNIRKGFPKLWEKVMPHVFEAMGFMGVEGVGRVVPVCFLLVAIGVLIGCMIQLLKKNQECGQKPLIWAYILLWISLGATMAAVAFTTMESSKRYYFLIFPIMAFGFICFMHWVHGKASYLRVVGCALVLYLLIFQIREIYLPVMESKEPAKSAEYEVCKYLQENHYEIAYTSFDKGNVITVLSQGAVRGAAVGSMESMDMCKWLSSTDWYVPNMPYHSRTAYVVPEEDLEAFERFCASHAENIWFETKIEYLYIYGSDYNLSCLWCQN